MSYSSDRNKRSRVAVKQIQQELPLWKSPLTWFCAIGSVSLIGIPLFIDGFTHRVNSVLMVDVSLSNQRYKTSLESLCQQYTEHLVEGDTRIEGKFADKTTILSNQKFQERDRLSLQNQCKQITLIPPSIGKVPGTSLVDALSRIETEIQHQHSQGNAHPVAAIIAIDSAELVNKQPQKGSLIQSKIESIVQTGGALVIIGSAVDLQNQLSSQLTQFKNTQICTYADTRSCLDWLFERVRK